MAATDETAKKLLNIVKNVFYALEEARERGMFRTALESTCRNINTVYLKLQELQTWITNYNNEGRTKGMLRRFRDYFYAGDNLNQLNSLSMELDAAFKNMHMSLSLEVCAGVKDLVDHQSSIAKEVFGMIQQHSGRPDDHALAEFIAKKTNIAVQVVKQELVTNMEYLRRVVDDVAHIKSRMDALTCMLEKALLLKAEGLAAPPSNIEQCLELAPFGVSEWVEKWRGKPRIALWALVDCLALAPVSHSNVCNA